MIEVRTVALEQICDLRDRILSPGHPGRPVIWPYDDEASWHYGAFQEMELLGCMSACPGSLKGSDLSTSFRFHSMAVEADWQRRGIGRTMLGRLARDLLPSRAQLVWGTARETAVEFYDRCGFSRGDFVAVEETGFEVQYVTVDRLGLEQLARE